MSDVSVTQINEVRLTDFREWPHLQFISAFLPWTFFGPRSVASSTGPLISEPWKLGVPYLCVPPLVTPWVGWSHRHITGLAKVQDVGEKWEARSRVAEPPHIPEPCWAARRGPRNKPQGTGPSHQLVLWSHKRWKLAQKPLRVLALRRCHSSFQLMKNATFCPYADNLSHANIYPNPTWSGKDTELGWALMTDSSQQDPGVQK